MRIFRSIGSLIFCCIALLLSTTILVLILVQQLLSPSRLITAIHTAHVPEQLAPTLAEQFITSQMLKEQQIDFLNVGELQTFASSLFTPTWVDAHLTVFIQQTARLTHSGAQLSDGVFFISLEDPKQRFVAQFEELKRTTEMSSVGAEFAAMDPHAITDTLPDTIQVLHVVAGNAKKTAPTPYDPLGMKQYADPLSDEEIDALAEVQEKIDVVQLWSGRIALIIPGLILVLLCVMGGGALWHISSGSPSVLHWFALCCAIASLPWLIVTIGLRFFVHGRILDILHDVPQGLLRLIDQTLIAYSNSLSMLTFLIFLLLLCAASVCVVWAHRLHKRVK
ncbi:MAG: hypothetical protein KIH62_001190 [Candidatus Kerfeldbacteria bacterium]|nr:hypothetical protein [Candidatus Kerfeldbacteria bacterium]